jgi:ABC-type glycerol-3-phosphate transport system substrate-binding protein
MLTGFVDQFSANHPFVEFRINFFPPETMKAELESALEVGTQPSVFFAPTTWGYEFHRAGNLRDVSSYLIPEYELELKPLALESVFSDAVYFGVPLRMEGTVLYRNRSLAPMPPATMEDLIESSQGIQGLETEGAILDFSFLNSGSQSQACEVSFTDEVGIEAFQGEAGQCWLQLLQTWSEAGPVLFASSEDSIAFEAGQAGWIMDDTSNTRRYIAALEETNLAVDPWPVYGNTNNRLAGYVWSEAAHFPAASDEEDFNASIAFILSLLESETQLSLSGERGGNQIPVRAGIEPTSGLMAQLLIAIDEGTPLPHGVQQYWYIEVMERAARAVSVQGTTVELAHLRAIDELRRALETQQPVEDDDV